MPIQAAGLRAPEVSSKGCGVAKLRKGRRAILVVAAALSASACTLGPTSKPLRYSAVEFQRTYDTLCLGVPELPHGIVDADEKAKVVATALATGLAARNYTVVDADRTGAVWGDVVAREGGFHDPLVGAVDLARFERIRLAALRELHDSFECDAYVAPQVVVVMAPFEGSGEAHWDGVTDQVPGIRGMIGRTGALSLWVTIFDLGAREVYFGTGGIEILEPDSVRVVAGAFQVNDGENVLGRSQRLALAVQEALEGIDPSAPADG